MATLDWIIVAIFMIGILLGGMLLSKKASGNLANFFLSGRNLPWWLAGTSILATSFASDTPLHTTRVIREDGLNGAWFYWSGIIGHLVITFCFARMWRRTHILTDAELIELRYTGKPAAVLRGTLATFRSVVLEALTLGWVTAGMVKVVGAILDLPETLAWGPYAVPTNVVVVLVLLLLVLAYSVSAGLWGVVATDFIEFIVALVGAIVLAAIAYSKVGYAEGLREGLAEHAPGGIKVLDFFSAGETATMTSITMGVYLAVLWWANDYIDGSGKRAQRFLACRSEKDALGSGIWNLAVQWILRTWPWNITALASIILYPHITDHEMVYPTMMAELLPIGLRGLMVAAFLAAFMSTVDTHLTLCSSYLVNDLYKRFYARDRDDEHYVRASRYTIVFVAVVAGTVALSLPSILGALKLKAELIGGLGLILLLRWFWWRINAWSEITAIATSVCMTIVLRLPAMEPALRDLVGAGNDKDLFAVRMLIIVLTSAITSIGATYLMGPEPQEHLEKFYRRVAPPKYLWGPVAKAAPEVKSVLYWGTVVQMLLCGVFVFCGMFGLGKWLLGETALGIGLIVVSAITCVAMLKMTMKDLSRTDVDTI